MGGGRVGRWADKDVVGELAGKQTGREHAAIFHHHLLRHSHSPVSIRHCNVHLATVEHDTPELKARRGALRSVHLIGYTPEEQSILARVGAELTEELAKPGDGDGSDHDLVRGLL